MFRAPLFSGVAFALAAGLMWGLVFIAPLFLPGYPSTLLSFGRYLAFGLIALPLGWVDRNALRGLTRADWFEALKLALVGNIIYYLLLATGIQRAGAPLPTMIIGTLPVVIAIASNLRRARPGTRVEKPLAWRRLLPSLVLIGAGIALVNRVELVRLKADPQAEPTNYAFGALLTVAAVACWTWYPIRNAEWLRAHPGRSARGWATAQGLMTLPIAFVGYATTWFTNLLLGSRFDMPFGPHVAQFLLLMLSMGLLSSWLGTVCWNEASQRLPPALSGQLIIFETLAALGYAFALRGHLPQVEVLLGVALLCAGVVWAVRMQSPE